MSTLATLRYDYLNTPSQGVVGNYDVRCQDPNNPDRFSGNVFVQQYITVAGTNDATDLGTSSISTKGGIDLEKSLLAGGDGTFRGNVNATSASLSGDVSASGQLIGSKATLSGTDDNTLSVLNGGITSDTAKVNTRFNSYGSAQLAGNTQVTGPFTIQTNTESTSVTTGSLISVGGIGIGGRINAGNNISTSADVIAVGQIKGAKGRFTATDDAVVGSPASVDTLGGLTVAKSGIVCGDLLTGGGVNTSAFRLVAKASTNEINLLPDGVNSAIYANTDTVTFGSTLSKVLFNNTTDAVDYSTGGVQILGGVSIQKKLYVKGDLHLSGSVTGSESIAFTNKTASTLPTNGAVIVSGGMGVDHVTVGSYVIAGLTSVLAATNTTSGNLQSRGGAGIQGDIYGGGKLVLTGLATLSGGFMSTSASQIQGTLTVTDKTTLQNDVTINSNTTPANATSAAALHVIGGSVTEAASYYRSTVNVSDKFTLEYNSANASQLYLNGPTVNTAATIGLASTGFNLIAPTGNSANVISDTSFMYVDGTGVNAKTRFQVTPSQTTISNTVDATALGTAGFVTQSGASIALSAIIGQRLNVLSTTDATSLTNAAFISAGGAAVTKQLRVGGVSTLTGDVNAGANLTVIGNTTIGGLTTLSNALTSTSTGSFAGSLIAGGMVAAQSTANANWSGPTSVTQPTGALVAYGGSVVKQDHIVGGNETIYGTTNLLGATNMSGNVVISSTTSSTNAATQALVVKGGVSIGSGLVNSGPAIFYGDMFLYGKMTQRGTTDIINVDNYYVKDNIVSINVGNPYPDSGICFHRYQYANDAASGFVVTDVPYFSFTVASSAADAISVKLPATASTVDNYYVGWLKIVSGTGQGEVRHIKSYNGSTQTITISSTADQTAFNASNPPDDGSSNLKIGLDFTTAPDSTSVIQLYNASNATLLQQQLPSGPIFKLGYLANDPLGSSVNNVLTKLALLQLDVLDAATSVTSDAYLPHTSGGDITLNNTVKVTGAGALNNVTSINGAPGQLTFVLTVSESAFNFTGSTTIPINKTFGTLAYAIIPSDDSGSRTYGSITCNRASTSLGYGSPSTSITQLPGTLGEQVAIVWSFGSQPQLTLSTSRPAANQTGTAITYTVYATLF